VFVGYVQMRKRPLLLLLALMLFSSAPALGQTPSLVQYANDMEFPPPGTMSAGQFTLVYLPNPSGAGNLITVCFGADESASIAVSDDKSNTYHPTTIRDTTNAKDTFCYYAGNVATGTKQIRLTVGGSTNWIVPAIAEWSGVLQTSDPIDTGGAKGAFATSTNVQAGSYTPTVTGDLVMQFTMDWGRCCFTPGTTWTQGSQANITWNLWLAENEFPAGAQWGVYNSTSALNATMSVSAGDFATLALFFKPCIAPNCGTPQGAGIQVVGRKTLNSNAAAPFNANPRTVQVPCPAYSNLMVVEWATGGIGEDISSISSSPANTWTALPAVNGGTPFVHNRHAANATLSPTTTLTFNFAGVSSASGQIYCVKGAAVAPYDSSSNTNTTQNAGGPLPLGSITPSTANGLIFVVASQEQNTSRGLSSPANGQWDGCFHSNEPLSVSGCSQNNAFGHYLNPNTSAATFTATQTDGTAVLGYVAEADSYKPYGNGLPNAPTGLTATVK
jgi:hypothetical protein